MYKVVKRDGKICDFRMEKISVPLLKRLMLKTGYTTGYY